MVIMHWHGKRKGNHQEVIYNYIKKVIWIYIKNKIINFFPIEGDIVIDFEGRAQNSNLYRFIEAFRKNGHKCSKINPVPIRALPR